MSLMPASLLPPTLKGPDALSLWCQAISLPGRHNRELLKNAVTERTSHTQNEGVLQVLRDLDKLDAVDGQGRTLVHYAALHNHSSLLANLIHIAPEIDALRCGPETAEWLRPTRFLDRRDGEGRSAMHYVTSIDMARMLVEGGAIYNLEDRAVQAPVDVARIAQRKDVQAFLEGVERLRDPAKYAGRVRAQAQANCADAARLPAVWTQSRPSVLSSPSRTAPVGTRQVPQASERTHSSLPVPTQRRRGLGAC